MCNITCVSHLIINFGKTPSVTTNLYMRTSRMYRVPGWYFWRCQNLVFLELVGTNFFKELLNEDVCVSRHSGMGLHLEYDNAPI